MVLGSVWEHFVHFSSPWGCFEVASDVVCAFWVLFCRIWRDGGGLDVGFLVKKIEKNEKFQNALKSIRNGFGECLGAYWCSFRRLRRLSVPAAPCL